MFTAAPSHSALPHSVFATNDLRTFRGGMDRDVLRRLLVITVSRTVPEERIEYIGLRRAGGAGFAPRLRGRGSETVYQRRYFAEPESSRVALREWVLGADPVLAWLEEAVTIVIGNMPARVKKRASRTSVSEPP